MAEAIQEQQSLPETDVERLSRWATRKLELQQFVLEQVKSGIAEAALNVKVLHRFGLEVSRAEIGNMVRQLVRQRAIQEIRYSLPSNRRVVRSFLLPAEAWVHFGEQGGGTPNTM